MSTESERYRDRAKDCRNMAAPLKAGDWRAALMQMAEDFEEEADRLDNEGRNANQP